MIYRTWEFKDILSITKLESECFAGESWTYQMFASSFETDGFFGELCEEEGRGERILAAYGCVQCVLDSADLMSIAVAPQYRGQGIGKTMLKRLANGAKRRGAERLFLEVRASNDVAQAMYTGEGFTIVSIRKKYYPDGEDALVMVKEL